MNTIKSIQIVKDALQTIWIPAESAILAVKWIGRFDSIALIYKCDTSKPMEYREICVIRDDTEINSYYTNRRFIYIGSVCIRPDWHCHHVFEIADSPQFPKIGTVFTNERICTNELPKDP